MRVHRSNLTRCLAAGAFLAACGGSAPPAAAPSPAAPPPAEADSPAPDQSAEPYESSKPDVPPAGSAIDRIMQAHFQDALLIRKAVIAGAPEQAANPAYILTQLQDVDELPESWQGFVAEMQRTAARINDSTTASMAAAATADLGLSCGMCHQKNGGPQQSVEPAPAAGGSVGDRMKRHVWATERLWEGLFVPSDAAWIAGAHALSPDPFPEEVLEPGGVHARSAASDFSKLAAKAPQKKSAKERADLYAELLVTCGGCHRSLKKE